MPSPLSPASWVTVASVATLVSGAIAKSLRSLYHRKRNRDVVDSFVYDVATNHLPHIYDAQRQMVGGLNSILRQVGSADLIELAEPPPVQFIDFARFDHTKESK